MTVGNTDKNGNGQIYWVVVDDLGRSRVSMDYTVEQKSDVVADDSDKSWTVTADYEWHIKSIHVQLISSGDTGNRQMAVLFTDGSDNIVMEVMAGAVQAASLTRNYTFAPALPDLTSFRNTSYLTTPIPDMTLPAGYKIRVYDIAAIAAAADDMYVRIMVESRPTA